MRRLFGEIISVLCLLNACLEVADGRIKAKVFPDAVGASINKQSVAICKTSLIFC